MNTRWAKVFVIVLMALVVVWGLNAGVNATIPRATASDGGIVGASNAVAVLDGTTAYTTSVNSDQFESRFYGSVQVMAVVDVTGTQVLTVTPQFSLENLPCSQVTQWADSESYVTYQPSQMGAITASNTITSALADTSDIISETTTITSGLEVSGTLVTTNTTTITVTVTGGTLFTTTNGTTNTLVSAGAPVITAIDDNLVLTGDSAAQREVVSGGLCVRAALTWDNTGETYTPTVVMRGLNRSK